MRRYNFFLLAITACLTCNLANYSALAQVDGPELVGPDDTINPKAGQPQADAEALGRGPIHEAFAEQVDVNPAAAPIVAKKPPEAINEIPPEIKPEGESVSWIPGYWAWDDERNEFIWVSGVWRKIPPGRRWVPGYWNEAEGGFRWVAGTWAPADVEELDLLPPPPESLEQGPNRVADSEDELWIPGCWVHRDNRYGWRPGYWSQGYANWVWIPDRYVWTPRGCLHVSGYWDYPVSRRGYLFAPYRFRRDVYRHQDYVLAPHVALHVDNVFSHLFVRPRCHHYYYGDYYGSAHFNRGYLPWHHYHKHHYCPLLSHYSWHHQRRGVNYVNHLHRWHEHHLSHSQHRPHHSLTHVHHRHQHHAAHVAADARRHARDVARDIQNKKQHALQHARQLANDEHRHRRDLGSHVEDFAKRSNPTLAAVRVQDQQRKAAALASRNEVRELIDQRNKASKQAAARSQTTRQKIHIPHAANSALTNRATAIQQRSASKAAETQHRIRESQQRAAEIRGRVNQKPTTPVATSSPVVRTTPRPSVPPDRKPKNSTRRDPASQVQSRVLEAQRRAVESRAKASTAKSVVPAPKKNVVPRKSTAAPAADRARQNRASAAAAQVRASQQRAAQQRATERRTAQTRAKSEARARQSRPTPPPKTQRKTAPRPKPQRQAAPPPKVSRPAPSRRSAAQTQRERARERKR
jgi:hypothetical protein